MNLLLPVVRELAEEVVRLKSGRLFAKSSTEGPRSLEELRMLLERAEMWAVAWMIEREIAAYDEPEEPTEEEEGEFLAEEFAVAKDKLEAIEQALLQREPVWKMLKAVQHILYGDDVPLPPPPATSPYGGALRPRDDDDVPF